MNHQEGKLKVYLDTSVISYLEQEDAPHEMQITREVWEQLKAGEYDVYISNIVLKEISNCRDEAKRNLLKSHLEEITYTEVEIDDAAEKLSQHFIDAGILKAKNSADCRHIAATILNKCDIIISWNFKHIVNVKTIRGIKVITTENGYKDILIYPPEALLQEGGDEND